MVRAAREPSEIQTLASGAEAVGRVLPLLANVTKEQKLPAPDSHGLGTLRSTQYSR